MSEIVQSGVQIEVHGEEVILLPQRAVYWSAKRILLVSDLHWGKGATFRLAGIPVPQGLLDEDLHRLRDVVLGTGADQVICLGDLVHGVAGLTPETETRLIKFLDELPARLHLVLGNHDLGSRRRIEAWGIETSEEELDLEPFLLSHEPRSQGGRFTWSGHIHPVFEYKDRREKIRLPCFHLTPSTGVLPAFSFFSGGQVIPPTPGAKVYAIAEGALVDVSRVAAQ